MNQKLKTSIAFTKNLFVTGAFTETSKEVEIEICKHIPKGNNKIVVEFGMGHGNITREILNTISPSSKLYTFEVKKSFCDYVRNTIIDDRLTIVNDSAENITKYIDSDINSVIASIPFSFFSNEKGMRIIQGAYDLLTDNAYYSQVLYTKFNFKKFQKIFEDCDLIKINNTPTEYIYHCRKIIS